MCHELYALMTKQPPSLKTLCFDFFDEQLYALIIDRDDSHRITLF